MFKKNILANVEWNDDLLVAIFRHMHAPVFFPEKNRDVT
jgi:hypothetical protein